MRRPQPKVNDKLIARNLTTKQIIYYRNVDEAAEQTGWPANIIERNVRGEIPPLNDWKFSWYRNIRPNNPAKF